VLLLLPDSLQLFNASDFAEIFSISLGGFLVVLNCFLFLFLMLGLHKLYVGRVRGSEGKGSLTKFLWFTHKRRQISPICTLFFSLWDNYCSVRKRWWVFLGCELSYQVYSVNLSPALRR